MKNEIDINCDLGEGADNDAAIMPFITSANIACGYHAGDEKTMMETILLAMKHNVYVGAHPSFLDRENFGRTEINCSPAEVYELVIKQLNIFKKIADECSATIHHVKPHGALYNMAAKDPLLAKAIAEAVKDFNANLILFGLRESHSIIAAQAAGLTTWKEVFVDRTYQDDGTLTPRNKPFAVINEKDKVIKQLLEIVKYKTVTAISGKKIAMDANTICIHGDGKNAVAFAHQIFSTLKEFAVAEKAG